MLAAVIHITLAIVIRQGRQMKISDLWLRDSIIIPIIGILLESFFDTG